MEQTTTPSRAALELASAHPARVRSLTLISSPGAQEFELLGNPLVNKIVYGFQGAGFWIFTRLTPSFGAVDLLPLDRNYAKTVFDTDMTDSKKILSRWTKPLLLVHGDADWLTLNRPDALNAMSLEMVDELNDYFGKLYHDRSTRVVVMRGAGRAFCAGLDIKDRS